MTGTCNPIENDPSNFQFWIEILESIDKGSHAAKMPRVTVVFPTPLCVPAITKANIMSFHHINFCAVTAAVTFTISSPSLLDQPFLPRYYSPPQRFLCVTLYKNRSFFARMAE